MVSVFYLNHDDDGDALLVGTMSEKVTLAKVFLMQAPANACTFISFIFMCTSLSSPNTQHAFCEYVGVDLIVCREKKERADSNFVLTFHRTLFVESRKGFVRYGR